MSVPFQLPDVTVTDSEITRWLRTTHLKKTQANITRATNALRAEKQFDSIPLGRDVTIQSADAARQVIYGFARVGGVVTFADFRGYNQYIDLIITIAGHEIDGVSKLYVDDTEVVFQGGGVDGWAASFVKPDGTVIDATNKLFMRVANGAADQQAILDLAALNSKWTPSHRQRSCAHVYIMLVWDGLLYGDSVPDFQFLVRGKPVYDPRTGTRYFSNLASLCAADYMMDTTIGMGIPTSRIDLTSNPGGLWEAANTCGDSIDVIGGGTEVRYAVNGYFQTDESHGRILERMTAATGGNITYSNGIWKFWPAKWRAPTLTITVDDLRGPIRLQTLASRDDIFNLVRGRYVSAAKGYIETDYPSVKNSSYIADDGGIIPENIDYQFVTSPSTCQRLSKLELERIRQGEQLDIVVSFRLYQLQVPETVAITFSRYGWVAKPFEVVRSALVINEGSGGRSSPEILVALSLRETAEGVFAWNLGNETIGDVAPNTNLPSPTTVAIPQNVVLASGTNQLYIRGDGTIQPRIRVSWSAFNDFFVTSGGRIEIQFTKLGDADWIDLASVPGSSTFAYISDVKDGQVYHVRVRSVNAFQYASEYATVLNHFVIGKTAPPADVAGIAGVIQDFGISLGWPEVADFDLAVYEIREGASWNTATFIDRVRSNKKDVLTRSAGAHTFLIKARDTSENYSVNAASVTITIYPGSISNQTFSIEGTDVIVYWGSTAGSFAISDFVIREGATFATSTIIATTRGNTYRKTVDWGGVKTFWITTRDVAGNESAAVNVDATILVPDIVINATADVIRNNVLFKWSAPTSGTLPIDHYLVLKGAIFSSATQIGNVAGTFAAYFELVAGDNTYWILAVDSAGNHGAQTAIGARVTAPQDFVLHTNEVIDPEFALVLDNIAVEGAFLRPPIPGGWVDIGGFGV